MQQAWWYVVNVSQRNLQGIVLLWLKYLHSIFVCLIDETVVEDSQTFIAPDANEALCVAEAVWGREQQALTDAGEVTQVEDVVELGRRWGQVNHNDLTWEGEKRNEKLNPLIEHNYGLGARI